MNYLAFIRPNRVPHEAWRTLRCWAIAEKVIGRPALKAAIAGGDAACTSAAATTPLSQYLNFRL